MTQPHFPKAKRVTIDLDPTDDPTHGQQQLALFNGYYESWCYLPILGFISFNDEVEQYLFTAVLRAGNAPAKLGAVGILRRVIDRLRDAFPRCPYSGSAGRWVCLSRSAGLPR